MTRGTEETTKALYGIYKRLLAQTPYMDWQVTGGGLDYYVQATMEEILHSEDPRLDGKNYLYILIFQASFEMKWEMTCYIRHLLIKRLLQFFLLFMFLSATKRRYTITRCPSLRPSVCLLPTFDHSPEVRSSRNRSRICIFEKVTSGHRSRGRPKSGSTGTGEKLVILVHFFALLQTPPTVLIGEC